MTVNVLARYRVHPELRWKAIGKGRVEINLPFGSTRLRADKRITRLFESLKSELPQADTTLAIKFGKNVFETLVKYFFLLPDNHADALSGGLCTPVARPAGCALAAHDLDTLRQDDLVIFHAPISTTSESCVSVAGGGRWVRTHLARSIESPLGVAGNPGILLDLDFGSSLDIAALRLFDLGDIIHRPLHDSAHDIGKRAAYLCQTIAGVGARPMILGGDHTLAYYSIGALAQHYPRLGVVQFDAHPDLYAVGTECDEQLNHANVMHWVRHMPHVHALWQVGVRDFFHQPTTGVVNVQDPKVHMLSAFEAETLGYGRLLDRMDRSLPWFITFDVDALKVAELPQTATPVLGGLSFYPLLTCFEQLFCEFRIVGMEFVEIGNAPPGAHGPATIAARLASRFLFHLYGAKSSNSLLYSPIK